MARQPRLQPLSFEAAFPSQGAPPTSLLTCGKRVPITAAIFEIKDLQTLARVWKGQFFQWLCLVQVTGNSD